MNKKDLKPRVDYSADQIAIADNRIRRTCHSKQGFAVFDPAPRVSICVGRGGGKTAAMLLRLIRRMIRTSNANCLFIAATRASAERLVWRDLRRIVVESLRLAGADFSEADLTLELPNGSRLMLCGCDDKRDIQKLRGITYHEVAIDEVASIAVALLEELLYEVLGPRMLCCTLGGTPGHVLAGLFYDATRPGSDQHRPYADRDLPEFEGWDKWSSHRWSIRDGVAEGIQAMVELYAIQLAEIARQGWSETNPRRLREYEGIWAADFTTNVYAYQPTRDGVPWNEWNPKRLANGFAELPASLPASEWAYGIGIDVGFKDAFALQVGAFNFEDPSRTLYQVYEVYRTRQYAKAIAQMLIGERLDHNRYEGIVGAIGWPIILVGDFANAGGALLLELAEVYGIVVEAADKPYKYKDNAIELVNSDLYDGRQKVLKGSALASEMGTLQWIVDPFGKRAENKAQANHACDAWLYLRNRLSALLPSALAGADAPKPPEAAQPAAQRPPAPPPEMPTDSVDFDDSRMLASATFDEWAGF